jgi:hypothetical protein
MAGYVGRGHVDPEKVEALASKQLDHRLRGPPGRSEELSAQRPQP